MSSEPKFRVGDVVKSIGQPLNMTNCFFKGERVITGIYECHGWPSIGTCIYHPDSLERVYRPPTREKWASAQAKLAAYESATPQYIGVGPQTTRNINQAVNDIADGKGVKRSFTNETTEEPDTVEDIMELVREYWDTPQQVGAGTASLIRSAITALVADKNKAESELSALSLILKDRDDLVRQLFDSRDAAYRAVVELSHNYLGGYYDGDRYCVRCGKLQVGYTLEVVAHLPSCPLNTHADVIAKAKEYVAA